MKHTKKLIALVLAALMIAGMSTIALASGNNGQITVTNTQNGIAYNLYRIFDMTVAGTGANATYAYTVNSDWTNFFATGGDGETYLVDTAPSGATNPVQITFNGASKYVDIYDTAKIKAFANAALVYVQANNLSPVATQTSTGANVVFQNLPLGYYIVWPENATQDINNNGSICSLTNSQPAASIEAKGNDPYNTTPDPNTTDKPVVGKETTSTSVEVGAIIEWEAQLGFIFDAVGLNQNPCEQTWTDTMPTGLVLQTTGANAPQIKVGNGNWTTNVNTYGMTLTATAAGWTLSWDAATAPTTNYKDQTVVIKYKTKVGPELAEQAATNPPTAVVNRITGSDPIHGTNGVETTAEVYTCNIKIQKTNDQQQPLAGAKFKLYRDNNGTKEYYQYTNNEVKWVTNAAQATEVTTNAQGEADFLGLKDGIYYLEETAAPAGYNMLPEPVQVDVAGNTTVDPNVGQVINAPIVNNKGGQLPGTGGIGTTIFYVLGGVLLVGAAVVLVTRRRMNSEN